MTKGFKTGTSPETYFEEFCEIAKEKNVRVISKEEDYINAHVSLDVICLKCKKPFKADLNHWKFGEGKRGCPHCVGKYRSMEDVHQFCQMIGWKCLDSEYKGVRGRYSFLCPAGTHKVEKEYRTFKRAHQCHECLNDISLLDFERLANEKGFDILSDKTRVIFNQQSVVKWKCSRGHIIKARYSTVISKGCPECNLN